MEHILTDAGQDVVLADDGIEALCALG